MGWLESLVLLVCGILLIKSLSRGTRERFPPGPFAWPIVGHAYLLGKIPHQVFRDISKTYGDILGLQLGQQRAVVVSSPELAKEVLLTHDKIYANRPPFKFASILFYKNDIGFNFDHGPHWRKQRKVCMMELFTAKRLQELEYVRQEELHLLLRRIGDDAHGGTHAVNLGQCVGSMSARLIMRLLHSQATVEVAGENLHQLVAEAEQAIRPTLGDLITWLSCLDFWPLLRMRRLHFRVDKVLSAILAERKRSATHHDDLLQALLSKEVDASAASPHQETFTLYDIKGILFAMMMAGIHTTSLTLEWAMAELLRNPKCFHRLRQEIDTVVGEKKQIMDEDIAKLSYLKCIVKEVFRLHPILPLLVPRISVQECKVGDFILPKNTLMLVNVWAIGRNDKVWTNANQFMPERFEGKDVDVKGKHFELLPFGSGRRICLGMALDLSVVEVTLAYLVSNYDWTLPLGKTLTSIEMDEKQGLTANRASPLIVIPKTRVWPS